MGHGLTRLPMFHTSLALLPFAGLLAERLRLWTEGFPRSRRLSRPWPRLRRLGTGLSAFGIGWPAFPAVDGYLARLTRRRTAAGGDASAAWLRLLSLSSLLARVRLWVLWDDRNGCSGPQSRLSESARAARSQGFSIPADNFPNELARVCDSVGKSPAWRGLDAAFPSHFVVQFRGRGHRRRNEQHCELSGFGVCPRTEAQTVPGSAARIQSRYGPGERRSWSLTEGQPAVRQLQPMAFRIVW